MKLTDRIELEHEYSIVREDASVVGIVFDSEVACASCAMKTIVDEMTPGHEKTVTLMIANRDAYPDGFTCSICGLERYP
mgnify:CR=1 FL=1